MTATPDFMIRLIRCAALSVILLLGQTTVAMSQDVPIIQSGVPVSKFEGTTIVIK